MSEGPVPPSPGVGQRRKGPKGLPTLPASAFAAPESSTSDSFPIPHSPTTGPPPRPVDAFVTRPAQWHDAAGPALGDVESSGGIVVAVAADKVADAIASFKDKEDMCGVPVLALLVPLAAEPDASAPHGVNYTTTYSGTADGVPHIRAALAQSRVVNIDVATDLRASEGAWDAFEEFLGALTKDAGTAKGRLVLSNVLPPPDGLALPLVKLINAPAYQRYQTHAASLSLFPGVFLALRPPAWGTGVPAAAAPERKEWKRRIKMYLGPALEAFGFERLVFGAGAAGADAPDAQPGEWFALALEAFAELGVEQDAIDAVFGGNARTLFA